MGPVGVGPLEALLGVDIFSEMRAGERVFSVQKKAIAAHPPGEAQMGLGQQDERRRETGEMEFGVEGHGRAVMTRLGKHCLEI